MNKFFLTAAFALASISAVAQTDDPVIMTINGNPIHRSEFEYSYNKNNSDGVIDKKDVQDYVQLFVDYKLKVEAAKDAGYLNMDEIKTELQGYKEQMVFPTINNDVFTLDQAYKTYENTAKHYGDEDLLECQHILILMRQDATEAQQNVAKARIDSIYQCVMAGEDFAELAKKHSQDPGSARNGGELPRFGKGRMIPDFEEQAYKLKVGQISKPFKSPAGWHIIKMNKRAKFESFDFHKDNIIQFLKAQPGFQEAGAQALIDSLAIQKGKTKEEVFDSIFNDMLQGDDENKNLAQEYVDGTLMFEISKRQIWDVAASDAVGLQQYFEKFYENYKWNEKHFKGIVVHAKDKATFKKAKKLVKNEPQNNWAATIVKTLNNSNDKVVKVENLKVFKPGDNPAVDKLALKKKVDVLANEQFPYVNVIGKVMKQPETYEDVKPQILEDYRKYKEDEWVRSLRGKYPVIVNWEVVNTVNNH